MPLQQDPTAWRFWITFQEAEEGHALSTGMERFTAELQAILEEKGYRNLDPEQVYKKLIAIIKMGKQKRERIKLVLYDEPRGWKIQRVGREHRLFLQIDEVNRYIRFIPCPRKESYQHH